MSLDFFTLWLIPLEIYIIFTRNEAQEQHSQLDTIFDNIFICEPPGTYLFKVLKTYYMLAGETGQHVVGFLDIFIDIFLEIQNKRYSKILYLVDYVVPGLHFG